MPSLSSLRGFRAVVAGLAFGGFGPLATIADPPATPVSEEAANPPHLEKPGLPCMRNADGRLVAPGRGVDALRVGPFQSVQVNVAPGQLNILGDAANEPSMAVDPINPNRIAVGWRQFDSVASDFRQAGNGFSADGGLTWTARPPLEGGNFRSDPVLVSDATGKFYYNSLDQGFNTRFFTSTNGGSSWSAPIPGLGGDKQWFVVDPGPGPSTNAIYMAWNLSAGCCGNQTFVRFFNNFATTRGPQTIPFSPQFGTVALGLADNAVYVAGRNGQNIVLSRSGNARNPNVQTASFSSQLVPLGGALGFQAYLNPVGLLGQAYVQTDKSNGPFRGNVYMLASVIPDTGGDPFDVHFIRSTNGGQTWSSIRRVNQFDKVSDNSVQWFGMIDVAPNGRIDVLWNDNREDPTTAGDFSRLYYACSFDAGDTWHYDIPVAPEWTSRIGWPIQQKIGDYYDLKSDNDGVHVIYAATYNGEQDVYYLRVEHLDCNNNGQLDVNEIAAGQLVDCNDNDFPDICEISTQYAADCNNNGVPDDCDIAVAGGDCNGNRVPDGCEISADPSLDCDGNGELDSCQLTAERTLDCDQNGRLDSCDIASGLVQDCNNNSVPDPCDVSNAFETRSPRLSPIGAGVPQQFIVAAPPIATSAVSFTAEAIGDFNLPTETVEIVINGVPLGSVLGSAVDCSLTASFDELTVTSAAYNAAVGGGDALITLVASPDVSATLCDPPSYIRVTIRYSSVGFGSEDNNNNGVPDECEGLRGDMNCDGFITVGDIAGFVLALTDPAAYAIAFPNCFLLNADVNNDGFVTVGDISSFVALLTGN